MPLAHDSTQPKMTVRAVFGNVTHKKNKITSEVAVGLWWETNAKHDTIVVRVDRIPIVWKALKLYTTY